MSRDTFTRALEATQGICSLLKALSVLMTRHRERCRDLDRQGRSMEDLVSSILARARQAPSLIATWGPKNFILFYGSKSVNLEWPLTYAALNIMASLSQGYTSHRHMYMLLDRSLGCMPRKCTPYTRGLEDLGYIVYLAALKYTLDEKAHTIDAVGHFTPVEGMQQLRELTEDLIEGRIKYRKLLQAAQAFQRLIEINLLPLQSKLEEERDGEAKLYHVSTHCRGVTT